MGATMKKPKYEKGKKIGQAQTAWRIPAIRFKQHDKYLYVFHAKASELYSRLSINRRIENKDEGYQRTLSTSRILAVAKFIERKKVIPSSVLITFDQATYSAAKKILTVPKGTNIGWVIDGQHRLAGAHEAATNGTDIDLPVVAFVGLRFKEQVQQFVTINREAKGVPTSLYLDLLGHLPQKNPAEFAKERAADLATQLRQDESSPFFEKVVATISPKEGQVSLTNFVRKVSSHLIPDRGTLHIYTSKEQRATISNYFSGLKNTFPEEFERKDSIFFKTVGFGALWNAFPTFFSICLTKHGGFQVQDVTRMFQNIKGFDFSGWRSIGTGNSAELQAGEDLKAALHIAFDGKNRGHLKV